MKIKSFAKVSFRSAAVGLNPVHRLIGHVTVLLETHHVDFGKNVPELSSNDPGTSARSKPNESVSRPWMYPKSSNQTVLGAQQIFVMTVR